MGLKLELFTGFTFLFYFLAPVSFKKKAEKEKSELNSLDNFRGLKTSSFFFCMLYFNV